MNNMDAAKKKLFANYLTSFSPLSEQELEAVMSLVTLINFKTAETFMHVGDPAEQVGVVLKGVFRVFYLMESGMHHVRRFCPEGRIVGDLTSILSAEPAQVTIDALEASEVAVLNYRDLERLYDSNPGWQRLGRKLIEYYY
ncbi:MAG: cyclic nucleotide-binding domain-containing protein, partial [Proteobacteria bacterium]|nr:cyclic nucleotide-binding domain-containing protein [Pseudomonadota bacterium]